MSMLQQSKQIILVLILQKRVRSLMKQTIRKVVSPLLKPLTLKQIMGALV